MIEYFVLATFPYALVAGVLISRYPGSARIAAVWPALLTAMLSRELISSLSAGPRHVEIAWVPSLALSLSLSLDGLGLLFRVVDHWHWHSRCPVRERISRESSPGGPLLCVALRLHGRDARRRAQRQRPHAVRVLGADWLHVVPADWLRARAADARSAALQALIVTGAGGLALLAAGVLLVDVSGTASLSAMANEPRRDHRASRLCRDHRPGAARGVHQVGAGAVSLLAAERDGGADAGQRLSALGHDGEGGRLSVARMTPILGGTALWTTVVAAVGAATMLVGAYRSVQETDLKRILALLDCERARLAHDAARASAPREAITAALVYLVAHACYKGALFLVAGAIDHETGTRDIRTSVGPSAGDAADGRLREAPPRCRWSVCR